MGTLHPLKGQDSDLVRFFDFIYGDEEEGYVYSPTKNPVTEAFEQYFFKWPTEKAELIDHIKRFTATHEVYYGPALFRSKDATKDSFYGTNVIWAEFDGVLPKSLGSVPEPSIKVQSSTAGHEHWYWRLDNFVHDTEALESISQRVTYTLQADLSCWNANRVLRPPGTLHHESAKRTNILRWDTRHIRLLEFASLPELPVKLLGIGDINAVPEALEVVLKYEFIDEAISLFKTKAINKGHRSSAITKMAHYCIEMGMTNAETLAILYNVDDRWGKFKHRTDRKERLLGVINYVRAQHPVDVVERDVESIFRIYSYSEFMSTELKIEWVIPQLIHKRGLLCISGPSRVGKSQMTLRLAEKIAKGSNFLLWDIPRPMKTIFVSMEMAHEELLYMMELMSIEKNELLDENFHLMPLGSAIKLANPIAQAELNKVIEKVQPDGIWIDSFGVSVGDDLKSEKIIFQTLDYVHRVLRLEYGMFVGFIHHPRKEQIGNKKPNKLDDLYGSQYFGAAVSTAIGLWPSNHDIEVDCLKLRLAKPFEGFKITRTADIDFKIVNRSNPKTIDESDVLLPPEQVF